MGKKDQLLGAKGFRAQNWTEGNRKKKKFSSKDDEKQAAIKRRQLYDRLEKQDPSDIYQEIQSLEQHREKRRNKGIRSSEKLQILKSVYNKIKDDTYSMKTEGLDFYKPAATDSNLGAANQFLLPETHVSNQPAAPAPYENPGQYLYSGPGTFDTAATTQPQIKPKSALEREKEKREERRQKYSKKQLDRDDPLLDFEFENKREKKKL